MDLQSNLNDNLIETSLPEKNGTVLSVHRIALWTNEMYVINRLYSNSTFRKCTRSYSVGIDDMAFE